jgi:hypothetical protein
MSKLTIPEGEIILTNEYDLIGAGYDYQLRNGPGNQGLFDTGSFGLPGKEIRRLRFDHCFIIKPTSPVPWDPTTEDLKNFFRFVVTNEAGEIVTDVEIDFQGDPKYNFKEQVHYRNGYDSLYNIPFPVELPNGRYSLSVFVDPAKVNALPAHFFFETEGENIWMTDPPVHSVLRLKPFVPGSVTRKDLNPLAPDPLPVRAPISISIPTSETPK